MRLRKMTRGALTAYLAGLIAVLALAAAPGFARDPDGTFEKTLQVTGAVDLSVATRSGSIHVTRGPAGSVVIRGEIRLGRNWFGARGGADRLREIEQNPPISKQGNTVRIDKLEQSLGRNVSISYEIIVPEKTEVKADTGSGSVQIAGVEGPVSADTGSGSIRVEGIARGANLDTGSGSIKATGVGGSFTANTGSGSIRADLLGAGPVDLDTGSGSIRVTGVDGRLNAETGSGSIKIEGVPSRDWRVQSSSGTVTVVVPSNSNFELIARTSSGSIRTDFPVTVRGSFAKNRLEGRVGTGGPRLELRTSSGSVRIEEGLRPAGQ